MTAALMAAAFIAAIGTSILGVTVPVVQSEPSSGNVFRPQEASESVAATAMVTAGTTCDHFDGLVAEAAFPSLPSCMDADRSSTRNRSAGLRTRLKVCSPHCVPPSSSKLPPAPVPPEVAPWPPAPVPPLVAPEPLAVIGPLPPPTRAHATRET